MDHNMNSSCPEAFAAGSIRHMARSEGDEARDLSRKLIGAGERLKADFNAIAATLDLTSLQARTLLVLEQPCAMRSLAQTMGCEASNITGLADRLERSGLVERISDTTDRRVKLLTLTARGRKLRRALDAEIARESTVMARLSAAERVKLDALLNRLLGQ